MPAESKGLIYLDADTLQRVRRPGRIEGSSFASLSDAFSTLRLNESRSFDIYWLRKLSGAWVPVSHPGFSTIVEIYPQAAPLQGGYLTVTYEGESTEPIDLASDTLYDLEEAVNDLSTVSDDGGVTFSTLSPLEVPLAPLSVRTNTRRVLDRFVSSWNEAGTRSTMTFSVSSIVPESLTVELITLQEATATDAGRMAIITTPKRIAHTQLDTALSTPAISTTSITPGIGETHAVHEVAITPEPFPGDEFKITVSGGNETRWLPVDASGDDVSRALNDANDETEYSAWRTDASIWYIRYPSLGNKALPDVEGFFRPSSGGSHDLVWEDDLEVYEPLSKIKGTVSISVTDGSSVIRQHSEPITINVR